MKKGTIIGGVIAVALLIGIVMGIMTMRIFKLEKDLAEQTRQETVAVSEETPAVQQSQDQQGAEPQPQQSQVQQPATQTQPQPQAQAEYPWVDVETEVERIRAIYNDTVAGMNAGLYAKTTPANGVTAYYDGSQCKCVVVNKGVRGVDYSRWYYYENNQPIFAYFENQDAHRFYLYQGDLMRWRYSANAQDAQNAVNEDWGSSNAFYQWEDLVLTEARAFGP